MYVTVRFDINEKNCDLKKFNKNFIEYLYDVLYIGVEDDDDPFDILNVEIVPNLYKVKQL